MTVDKVIAKIIWLTFFWPILYIHVYGPHIGSSRAAATDCIHSVGCATCGLVINIQCADVRQSH